MKSIDRTDSDTNMLPEYAFDYSKAKPNRFAQSQTKVMVSLEPDVAAAFPTSEAVNKALRAVLAESTGESRSQAF
ncbi:hypothetical protein [Methylomagnum sp.]